MVRARDKGGKKLTASSVRLKNRGNNLKKWRQQKLLPPLDESIVSLEQDCSPVEINETLVLQSSNANEILEPQSSIVQTGSPECLVFKTTNAEEETAKYVLSGRRIVDINFFISQIQNLDSHDSPFDCSFKDMEAIKEDRKGLISLIHFKCKMCLITKIISTDDCEKEKMGINEAAVLGIMATGGGQTQLEEVFSVMNIPSLSSKRYVNNEARLGEAIESTSIEAMAEAAAEEAELARAVGDVDSTGIPLIPVAADGSWAKRSYRTNYSSLSGVAAIIGYRTKKVIYINVKNKYCFICERSAATGKECQSQHTCFKNWTGSSTAMESEGILQGFKQSMSLYGVKYNKLVADGDSSVYHKLISQRPYWDMPVQKIECCNHLLRNFVNKMKDLTKNKYAGPNYLRKKIDEVKIKKMRIGIKKAIEHRRSMNVSLDEKTSLLKKDVLNNPYHIFGSHSQCADYFCLGFKQNEVNLVPAMKREGLWGKLEKIVSDLAFHSTSLIQNLTSNCAEQFNSIIAKMIGGKRINFTRRGSYQRRCHAAVISHNTQALHSRVHQTIYKTSPGTGTKRLESKRQARRLYKQSRPKEVKRKLYFGGDEAYGPNANKPDMTQPMYKEAEDAFVSNLMTDCDVIQKRTRTEKGPVWLEERRKRVTASNFGEICRMRPSTKTCRVVKKLLYDPPLSLKQLDYGRRNEKYALSAVEEETGYIVEECGLLIDDDYPFLAATPDGLVGEDLIVEVKCPSSCAGLTIDQGIEEKKIKFLNADKSINRNHNYFFQVQGQLHISRRKKCLFGVWTPIDFHLTVVEEDKKFWSEIMFPKLKRFYWDCILPELVDPRKTRSLPLREPKWVTQRAPNN